jgi:hypothetical protein
MVAYWEIAVLDLEKILHEDDFTYTRILSNRGSDHSQAHEISFVSQDQLKFFKLPFTRKGLNSGSIGVLPSFSHCQLRCETSLEMVYL